VKASIPFIALLVFVGLAALLVIVKGKGGARADLLRKNPLTQREQSMYFRLTQSLPDHVVLAQVAFSSLLGAKSVATRNTFDRKVADFVVCSKAFEVLAVIELDDASHKGKGAADARRDEMLTRAGYRVIRYANVPDVDMVKADFRPMAQGLEADGPQAQRNASKQSQRRSHQVLPVQDQ
jgi:very-short-patch-repair endonuclease